MTVVRAEKRDIGILNEPFYYWSKGLDVTFHSEKRPTTRFDLGTRLKEIRSKRGLSQTELAKLVGVTPSTISQVESNQIYPSLPALIKMAEILSVKVSSFFGEMESVFDRIIFSPSQAGDIQFPGLLKGNIMGKALTPVNFEPKAEPYLMEFPPDKSLPSHFFVHKGEEIGYLLSGKLQLKLKNKVYTAKAGDVIYLTTEMPTEWKNPGPDPAQLLRIKIK